MKDDLRKLLMFFLFVAIVLAAAHTADEWRIWRNSQSHAPAAGTVLGLRYSGAYKHVCKLKLRPDGAAHRNLLLWVDPNNRGECLTVRVFDHWERQP